MNEYILACSGIKGTTVATWKLNGDGTTYTIKVYELQSGDKPYVIVKAMAEVTWNIHKNADKTLMLLKCLDSTAEDWRQETRWRLVEDWPSQIEEKVMEYLNK